MNFLLDLIFGLLQTVLGDILSLIFTMPVVWFGDAVSAHFGGP
jgi:hypothetical protein